MRTSLVVIFLVRIEQMAEIPFAEHNNMVKTIPSDRTDQPLRISVLPWRPYIGASVASRRLRSVDGQSNGRSGVRSQPATEARGGNAARSEIHTTAETRSSGLRTNPSTQCRRHDCAERSSSPVLPRSRARVRACARYGVLVVGEEMKGL